MFLKIRAARAALCATFTATLSGRNSTGSEPSNFEMITKVCSNTKCPGYAHFVYTVAMRCVICRCDLKSAQRISEAANSGRGRKNSRGVTGRSLHSKRTRAAS